jgi:type 1 fimbriae regulatory protein FimB
MATETIKYLTPQQVEKLISKINSPRDKAMFSLMYLYGLRISEATRITLDDLRLKDDRLFIHASKNGISGEQVLTKQAKKYLLPYLKERETMKPFEKILFLSKKGGQLTNAQVFRLFQKYSKLAKIPEDKRHPHVLRHSIAVHMAEDDVPVEYVQTHLRHRRIDNTMVYFQITNRKRHEMQQKALNGENIAKF